MRENEQPTVMPLRIMKAGIPPEDTVGRVLIRHALYGFMIGEMLQPKEGPRILCAVGIEPTPARTPICIQAVGAQAEQVVEWMPLIETEHPVDRVRAAAAQRRRDAANG